MSERRHLKTTFAPDTIDKSGDADGKNEKAEKAKQGVKDKSKEGEVDTSGVKLAGPAKKESGDQVEIDLQMEEFCRVRMNFNLVRQLIDEYMERSNSQIRNPTPGGPPALETLEVLKGQGCLGTPGGTVDDPNLAKSYKNLGAMSKHYQPPK